MKLDMPGYKRNFLYRGYSRTEKSALIVMQKYSDKNTAGIIIKDAKLRYEEVLYKIPYIGGNRNKLTSTLIFSAQIYPFIEILKEKGMEADMIGRIIYEIADECFQTFSAFFISLVRTLFFSPLRMSELKKRASESWKRKYKGDWVYKFMWENKNKYEYRIEYHECGIYKFYKELGCEEFVKYLCRLDFIIIDRIGIKLERFKTIAEGESICDFRYFR